MLRPSFISCLGVVAAASAFATVSLAGPASSVAPLADPVAFLRGVIRLIAANDYASAWRTLAPAQQRLVPAAEYVRCEMASPVPGQLTSLTVLRRVQEPVIVAGSGPRAVQSEAVTFRITLSDAALRTSLAVTHTVHAIRAGRHWAWILPAARLHSDRSASCAAEPTAQPRNS